MDALAVLFSRSGGIAREFFRSVADTEGLNATISQEALAQAGLLNLSNLIANGEELSRISEKLDRWRKSGIGWKIYGDQDFPQRLREIYDPPIILFYKGEHLERINNHFCISIVGSRRCDVKGESFAFELAAQLSRAGGCVVSGLAIGIDGAAHKGALDCTSRFPTVAVLGNGLEDVYPSAHHSLAARILKSGGLLISQFEPDSKPYPSNFLARNRIIAGLSKAVVVVQANKRSGALATARYAIEDGRDVFAVPGDPDNPRHEGTNNLIKMGACLLTGFEDLRSSYSELSDPINPQSKVGLEDMVESELELRFIEFLRQKERARIDELTQKFAGANDFALVLLSLELKGIIERKVGNYVTLNRRFLKHL